MPRKLSRTLMCWGKEDRTRVAKTTEHFWCLPCGSGDNSQVSTLPSRHPSIDEGARPQLGKEADRAE